MYSHGVTQTSFGFFFWALQLGSTACSSSHQYSEKLCRLPVYESRNYSCFKNKNWGETANSQLHQIYSRKYVIKNQARTEQLEWRQLLGLAVASFDRRKTLFDPQRGPLLPVPQGEGSGATFEEVVSLWAVTHTALSQPPAWLGFTRWCWGTVGHH